MDAPEQTMDTFATGGARDILPNRNINLQEQGFPEGYEVASNNLFQNKHELFPAFLIAVDPDFRRLSVAAKEDEISRRVRARADAGPISLPYLVEAYQTNVIVFIECDTDTRRTFTQRRLRTEKPLARAYVPYTTLDSKPWAYLWTDGNNRNYWPIRRKNVETNENVYLFGFEEGLSLFNSVPLKSCAGILSDSFVLLDDNVVYKVYAIIGDTQLELVDLRTETRQIVDRNRVKAMAVNPGPQVTTDTQIVPYRGPEPRIETPGSLTSSRAQSINFEEAPGSPSRALLSRATARTSAFADLEDEEVSFVVPTYKVENLESFYNSIPVSL